MSWRIIVARALAIEHSSRFTLRLGVLSQLTPRMAQGTGCSPSSIASGITRVMNTQRKNQGSTKLTRTRGTKSKPDVKVRDIAPTKDAKGGGTKVKDSHDRYA